MDIKHNRLFRVDGFRDFTGLYLQIVILPQLKNSLLNLFFLYGYSHSSFERTNKGLWRIIRIITGCFIKVYNFYAD